MHLIDGDSTIIIPCNIGDDFWYVDEEDGYSVKTAGTIKGIAYYGKGKYEIINEDNERIEPGDMFCCLSKEEAEAMRRKLIKEKYSQKKIIPIKRCP